MPEMKNICGKIPLDLHEKVRQEIEETESSTQKFILQVIEEHFSKGEMKMSMEMRTVAVQVTEELFGRLKAVIMKKGCKQKDFLLAIIQQAIEAEEAKYRQEEETELGDGELLEETAESSVEPQEGEVREQEDDGLETEESEPEESESVESNDEGTELDEQPEEPTEEIVSEETQVDLEEAI
ncbi:hypothetical protein [Blautia producta]|uniref:hypothetical protein n=1 Tax=Blautia producta TaxID=33035 RepID=UPI0031B5657A